MDSSHTLNAADDSSLIDNFGIAALIVVLGVALSWFVLKQNSNSAAVVLPAIPAFAFSGAAVSTPQDQENTSLERAELAFAAGNIGEPAGESALYFYQQALAENSEDEAAQQGLNRVAAYLLGTAESSVFSNDWSAAKSYGQLVLQAQPGNEQAQNLLARVGQYQQIETLLATAARQVNRSRLTNPEGNNALATYRQVLRLESSNEAANQGIRSIAQRLLASAQTAAFAGDLSESSKLLAKVKSFAPKAQGIAETEQLSKQWRQMSSDQSVQADLVAAAKALREDKLIAPKGNNALALFQKVLAKDPKSEAASRGLDLVAQELVNRAWTQVRGQDLAGAAQAVHDAKQAGAKDSVLAEINAEIGYQNRLANARLGRVDLSLPVSKLTIVRKTNPVFPKRAAVNAMTGWASIEFTVSLRGEVVNPKIIESSNPIFDRSALAAINDWRFEPHLQDGRPVPVRSGVRFSFQQ